VNCSYIHTLCFLELYGSERVEIRRARILQEFARTIIYLHPAAPAAAYLAIGLMKRGSTQFDHGYLEGCES
jgi:hypothetical protein